MVWKGEKNSTHAGGKNHIHICTNVAIGGSNALVATERRHLRQCVKNYRYNIILYFRYIYTLGERLSGLAPTLVGTSGQFAAHSRETVGAVCLILV